MSTLERQKEILELKVMSMNLKKTQCDFIRDLTSLIEYKEIIELDIDIAKRDLQEACESEFKDNPEIIRLADKLRPLIAEVEQLYQQKQSAIPA